MKTLYILSLPINKNFILPSNILDKIKNINNFIAESKNSFIKLLASNDLPIKNKKCIKLNNFNDNNLSLITNYDENYCLISDCGSPLICDPGFKQIDVFIKNDYKICPINYNNSILPALVLSRFRIFPFVFYGFFPKKESQVSLLFKRAMTDASIIFFLSMYRIDFALNWINKNQQNFLSKNYKLCLIKDIDSKYQHIFSGDLETIINNFTSYKSKKGQYIIVIQN